MPTTAFFHIFGAVWAQSSTPCSGRQVRVFQRETSDHESVPERGVTSSGKADRLAVETVDLPARVL